MREYHLIEPVYNKSSKILILGSFPSVKSREGQFFYHHPQNRFWKIFEQLFDLKLQTIEDKKAFLLKPANSMPTVTICGLSPWKR